MLKKTGLLIGLLLLSFLSMAQEELLLQSFLIPAELKENANAVIRMDDTRIEIDAINKLTYKNKRIVTILNSYGDSKAGAYMHYDNGTKIKRIEARIYNEQGSEIKKIRQKDFVDESAVTDGTLYSDSRLKYLDYTPISYPYTVVFETEVEYSSTAFIPYWMPIEGYYVSTQHSKYQIQNSTDIELNLMTSNFEGYNILNESEAKYSVEGISAIKYEEYSPSFKDFVPKVDVALMEFSYEGYRGHANNWNDLGKWMYDKLLKYRSAISESTKSTVLKLVEGIEDPITKAKIVYKFVQDNTRYISVQEGIGGIQPIKAIKVDEVKYGDCKGLSNYTKALLDLVGVKSYYTRVYGSKNLVNVNKEFVKFLGYTNHVIINIPNDGKNIWLECTSQTDPFGYTANFTDDRDVFVITPEGGKIVHTNVYNTEDNVLETSAKISLDTNGNIDSELIMKSYGAQYGMNSYKESFSSADQELSYKNKWSYINNLDIISLKFDNDKDSIVFTEFVNISAERYAAKAGKRLLLQPNFFNRRISVPKRYENRTRSFEIDRGYKFVDSYEIKIPETLEMEALMNPISIDNTYGSYKASIKMVSEDTLLYQREFVMNKGSYPKEDYNAFREFLLEVVKYDKSKMVFKLK